MPKEKADYRDLLERLDQAFPGRELISKHEVAAWLGVSLRTVNRRYSMPGSLVTKTMVARRVSSS